MWKWLFLFHLLEESFGSLNTRKTNTGSFFIPADSERLSQRRFCPPRRSGMQRWNAPLRKSRSGRDPSGSLVDVGLQGLVKSLKGGPVGYIATPTTHHQLEERGRTQRGGVKEYLDGKSV